MRIATKGGTADYYGITYERLKEEQGGILALPRKLTIPVTGACLETGLLMKTEKLSFRLLIGRSPKNL